jgi:16S rRNA (cytidine1402-2'-O)-methyltransferase
MPSISLTSESQTRTKTGTLYVVATPIGNQDDITLRALNVLRKVDLIAAEDTRKTRRFLSHHGIEARFISYHEHNETERTPKLIRKLRHGINIALVSNAGTPSVSDPGYRLILTATANSIMVIPIPGVSAAITALSVAGLPTDSFTFIGFLSKKSGKRLKLLQQLAHEPRTLVFYESPKRMLSLLEEIIAAMGNRTAVLAREMTKRHEEFLRGSLSELFEALRKRPEIRGECTLLVAGPGHAGEVNWEEIRSIIRRELASTDDSVSTIVRGIAAKYGLSKNSIYAEALCIRKQMENGRCRMPEDKAK